MRFAVISDLHVRIDGLLYGLDTQKRLDDVLSDIDREAPDLVVVTGDLADCADLGSYRLIKERLESLSRPVYVLPGNHDDPVQMRQIFPAAQPSVFFHRALTSRMPWKPTKPFSYFSLQPSQTQLPGEFLQKLCSRYGI